MSLILLLVGVGVLAYGRIDFGEVKAEGPPVRAAGFMLMMPFIATLFLGEVMRMLFGDTSGVSTALGIIDLIAMVLCVGVAYTLVYRAARDQGSGPTIINLPQFGRDKQETVIEPDVPDDNTGATTDEVTAQDTDATASAEDNTRFDPPSVPRKPTPPHPVEKSPKPNPVRPRRTQSNRKYPTIMSTAEAASYLEISEGDLMELIEQGKIAAARINYRYRISRDVLDEFINSQQTGSATAE